MVLTSTCFAHVAVDGLTGFLGSVLLVIAGGKLRIVGGMGENRTRAVTTEYLDIEKAVFVRGPDIDYGRCCGGGGIVDGVLAIIGGFVDGAGLGSPALPTRTLEADPHC
jgi:hypothetical protein